MAHPWCMRASQVAQDSGAVLAQKLTQSLRVNGDRSALSDKVKLFESLHGSIEADAPIAACLSRTTETLPCPPLYSCSSLSLSFSSCVPVLRLLLHDHTKFIPVPNTIRSAVHPTPHALLRQSVSCRTDASYPRGAPGARRQVQVR